MNAFMSMFNAEFFASIMSGVLSGICTWYITEKIMKHKKSNKYFQNANTANADILNSLKRCVTQRALPEWYIVDAIISSSARKNNVFLEDVYSVRDAYQELIKDIIDNTYILKTEDDGEISSNALSILHNDISKKIAYQQEEWGYTRREEYERHRDFENRGYIYGKYKKLNFLESFFCICIGIIFSILISLLIYNLSKFTFTPIILNTTTVFLLFIYMIFERVKRSY